MTPPRLPPTSGPAPHTSRLAPRGSRLAPRTSGLATRRAFLRGALLTGAALAAAACSAAPVATPANKPSAPVAKGEPRPLTVSIWGGITEESVRKWVLPRFEKEHNARVTLDVGLQGARYNKLLAQKAAPTVDVFFSTEELVYNGLKQDLFEKVDPAKLSNWGKLHDWAKPIPEYGPAAGLTTLGIAYHTQRVQSPPRVWADLWRPDLQGKLGMVGFNHSQGPALLIRAAELDGGSIEQVDPGFARLAQLRPSAVTLYFTEYIPQFLQGDVLVTPELDYYVQTLKVQGYPIEWALPDDGAFSVLQVMNVVKGTQQRELAEAFMDAYLEEESQRAIANDNYTSPSNKETTLEPTVAAKTMVGERLAKLRTFDLKTIAERRAAWTERFNAEVLPRWKA
jgi:putative spermidine/putrescine transport system substrate-binding protein